MADLKDRTFAAMSTGEQRRFLLGRALISDPDTLLLDEPTSGLDLKACFQYLDIVRGLMQAGKTVILVTTAFTNPARGVARRAVERRGRARRRRQGKNPHQRQLSQLFDTPIELVRANGFYQAMPGGI